VGGLGELALRPVPLGGIEPRGWLKQQLRIQADGLSGHLDEFWPDVRDSAWFGGDADSWERAPYWLDGFIPLAFLLGDERLIEKARTRVGQILDRQGDDGWLGPRSGNEGQPLDVWAHFLVDKALLQYHEATGEERVLDAVSRNLRMLLDWLDETPLFNWARYRWSEGLVSAFYVYDITGESWLLDLARKLHGQGLDWRDFYEQDDVRTPTPRRGMWKWAKHVVNTALVLKGYPMWSRLTGDPSDRGFARTMIDLLDRYHGQITGVFTGDECLAGTIPVQGTELCAVADYMYSLEHLVSLLGDPALADRLERIAFNAWPATNSPDMWSHQYDQQANQVQCTINEDQMWSTNGPESNTFGLEPNFGCCTANLHQAWPKLAASLWMTTPDEGVAAVAYAPSAVKFESKGVPVTVELDTGYPFREGLSFKVTADRPVTFPLMLRIPGWAKGAELKGRDGRPEPGTFLRLEREWRGTTEFELHLPMTVAVSRRYNNAVAVERGPLVYSLKIGEEWKRVNEDKPHREPPHADWEVRPTTDWNYALSIDEGRPELSVSFQEHELGDCPFSPDGVPVSATVKGRRIDWGLKHGWAAETPVSPVRSEQPEEDLTLIPYGCTNLRVTEFPVLARDEDERAESIEGESLGMDN
jgi:DUF1680 family protein